MLATTKCPSCRASLRIPNQSGRLRCPHCGEQFDDIPYAESAGIDWRPALELLTDPIFRTTLLFIFVGLVVLFVASRYPVLGLVLGLVFLGIGMVGVMLSAVRQQLSAICRVDDQPWAFMLPIVLLLISAEAMAIGFTGVRREAEMRHVNGMVDNILEEGRTLTEAGKLEQAEKAYRDGLSISGTTRQGELAEAIAKVQELIQDREIAKAKREATKKFGEAESAIVAGNFLKAKSILSDYALMPHADVVKSKSLRNEIDVATSEEAIYDRLVNMSKAEFAKAKSHGLPETFSYKQLSTVFQENVRAQLPLAQERRQELAWEDARKREEARLAAIQAEKERKQQEEREAVLAAKRAAEDAKRAEEETDFNGLVVYKKTVRGTFNSLSTTITGVVENRTGKNLRYAQITFSLFDSNGNRVGSAVGNILNLAPGSRWEFRAVALTSAPSFQLADLFGR